MSTKRDYNSLTRKLARGLLLADAAAQSGMTTEEAQDYLSGRQTQDDESLRSFADEALRTALNVLKRAAMEDDARVSSDGVGEGRYTSYDTKTDVDAAKALLKAGLDARKMLRRAERDKLNRQTAAQSTDLFDSPWKFKEGD